MKGLVRYLLFFCFCIAGALSYSHAQNRHQQYLPEAKTTVAELTQYTADFDHEVTFSNTTGHQKNVKKRVALIDREEDEEVQNQVRKSTDHVTPFLIAANVYLSAHLFADNAHRYLSVAKLLPYTLTSRFIRLRNIRI